MKFKSTAFGCKWLSLQWRHLLVTVSLFIRNTGDYSTAFLDEQLGNANSPKYCHSSWGSSRMTNGFTSHDLLYAVPHYSTCIIFFHIRYYESWGQLSKDVTRCQTTPWLASSVYVLAIKSQPNTQCLMGYTLYSASAKQLFLNNVKCDTQYQTAFLDIHSSVKDYCCWSLIFSNSNINLTK